MLTSLLGCALDKGGTSLWEVLRPLLRHEDVRSFVCYYAVRTLRRVSLKRILDDYPKQGRYYYNVIVLLDRALYAFTRVRRYFLQNQRKHFEQSLPEDESPLQELYLGS